MRTAKWRTSGDALWSTSHGAGAQSSGTTNQISYSPSDRMGLGFSVGWAYGVSFLVPHVLLVLAAVRSRVLFGRARRARAEEAKKPVLKPGHVTLHGKVETDTDDPAVVMRIHQKGREQTSNRAKKHVWTERSRDVETHPFWLLLEGGERVRVRADDELRLVDDLEKGPLESEAVRVCTATIARGDLVHAAGVLREVRDETGGGGGYRGGGKSWLLAGSQRERLFLSTKPLDQLFTPWAKFYRATAVLLGAALLFAQLTMLRFHALNLRGELFDAVNPTAELYYDGGKRPAKHYKIRAQVEIAGVMHEVVDESTQEVYDAVKAKTSSHVPFLVVRNDPKTAQIGTEPELSITHAFLMTLGWTLAAFLYYRMRRNRTPWYEQSKVVDIVNGPLPTG